MIPIPGISLKLLLLLLLPGTFATAGGLLLRPSSAPKFTTSGFYAYNSDENVGLNDVDGMVAAFGDFNADKACVAYGSFLVSIVPADIFDNLLAPI